VRVIGSGYEPTREAGMAAVREKLALEYEAINQVATIWVLIYPY
jgi:hypothetical protein